MANAVWEIPASRMKKKQPHTVPLATQALAVLNELRPITGHQPLAFLSIRPGRPI